MRIAELFKSIQGEGSLTGIESIFVRASGCNLRCGFCDTPYASWKPEGDDWPLDGIVQRVMELDCQHVVITGGEPMLFAELIPLTARLAEVGLHLTIETAGTLYLPVSCHLMSISPKLSNSTPPADAGKWRDRHERTRSAPEVLRRLVDEYDYQLKFVIDVPGDCVEVEQFLADFPSIDHHRVYLMPQGTEQTKLFETGEWLQRHCEEQGYLFCPRKQIEWFGLARGT